MTQDARPLPAVVVDGLGGAHDPRGAGGEPRTTAPSARWLAPATAVLGLGIALVAVLGPLVTGVIDYRVAPLLRDQLVGADLVSLVVVAPLTLLAAGLLRRGSPAGARLALATSLTGWYFAAELVLGPDRTGRPGNDEAFLPLFLAVLRSAPGARRRPSR